MCGIYALIGAGMFKFYVALFAAEKLEIAVHMCTVNVAVRRFSAMFASGDYDRLLGKIYRDGNTLIEDITFTFEVLSLSIGMLGVFNNTSVELINIRKAFF